MNEARAAIQEEMPLVVCCDLDLPDGSGMDFLDEVRITDKKLPFILVSCHDKDDYEQEAMRRGATLMVFLRSRLKFAIPMERGFNRIFFLWVWAFPL